jgi:mannose-6-phosphate isomerase-like protein (cupin superfamily)
MNLERSFPYLRTFTTQSVSSRIRAVKKTALLAIAVSLVLTTFNVRSYSQNSGAASYDTKTLTDLARQMRADAEKTAPASKDAVERHLDPVTILAIRVRSGRAELHTASTEAFFIVEGHATLVTGGTITNAQGKDEVRGDAIEGGASAELKPGDVVHIPANTPHQLLLSGAEQFIYILIKIPVR